VIPGKEVLRAAASILAVTVLVELAAIIMAVLVATAVDSWGTSHFTMCQALPSVPRVYDYAGLPGGSRYRPQSCCLPSTLMTSAS